MSPSPARRSRSRRTASRPARPDIAGAIGLGAAIDFIEGIGRDRHPEHEETLTGYAIDRLSRIPGLRLVGGGQRRLSDPLVQPRRRAPARCRHRARPARRRGPRRASLRPAADGQARPPGTMRASLGVYNDEATSTRWSRRSKPAGRCSPMIDLRELYQDIILDHGRHPRNFRVDRASDAFRAGHNPLCGDRVTVYLTLDGDRIADVSFQGRGCAISTAAASLMTEMLKGKTLDEAEALFDALRAHSTQGRGARGAAGARGRCRAAGTAVRRRLSDARQMRDPAVAYDEGGAGRRRRGEHRMSDEPNLHPIMGAPPRRRRPDGARRRTARCRRQPGVGRGDHRRDEDRLRPRDSREPLRSRPDLPPRSRPERRRRHRHDPDGAGLPGGRHHARQGRRGGRRRPGVGRSKCGWSGSRPGPRTACPKTPSSRSTCSETFTTRPLAIRPKPQLR